MTALPEPLNSHLRQALDRGKDRSLLGRLIVSATRDDIIALVEHPDGLLAELLLAMRAWRTRKCQREVLLERLRNVVPDLCWRSKATLLRDLHEHISSDPHPVASQLVVDIFLSETGTSLHALKTAVDSSGSDTTLWAPLASTSSDRDRSESAPPRRPSKERHLATRIESLHWNTEDSVGSDDAGTGTVPSSSRVVSHNARRTSLHMDMFHLVFDCLETSGRNQLLEHFASSAEWWSSDGATPRPVQVLSDVDDTFKCSYMDNSFSRGTAYPGIRPFYRALALGPHLWTSSVLPSRPGASDGGEVVDDEEEAKSTLALADEVRVTGAQVHHLTFISARPSLMKSSTRAMLLDEGAAPSVTVLTGRVRDWVSNSAMARGKVENFRRYAELFPECQFVWVGDAGQGDLEFAEAAASICARTRGAAPLLSFIHDVVLDTHRQVPKTPLDRRQEWLHRHIVVFDSYVDAAAWAFRAGLLHPEALVDVARQAAQDLVQLGIAEPPPASPMGRQTTVAPSSASASASTSSASSSSWRPWRWGRSTAPAAKVQLRAFPFLWGTKPTAAAERLSPSVRWTAWLSREGWHIVAEMLQKGEARAVADGGASGAVAPWRRLEGVDDFGAWDVPLEAASLPTRRSAELEAAVYHALRALVASSPAEVLRPLVRENTATYTQPHTT